MSYKELDDVTSGIYLYEGFCLIYNTLTFKILYTVHLFRLRITRGRT